MSMLSARTKIRLIYIASGFTSLVLFIAASGFWNNYTVLKLGIMIGLFILAGLSFLLGYRTIATVGILIGIFFSPYLVIHLPKNIWVILDILTLAGIIYFAHWATDSYSKGTRFEIYVQNLFPKFQYEIEDRTRDNSKFLKRRVASDSHPDFVFKNISTGKKFAVECKWRNRWYKNKEVGLGLWWDLAQWNGYRQYGTETGIPVYVALGVGGVSERPGEINFVGIDKLHYSFLSQSYLRSVSQPISTFS